MTRNDFIHVQSGDMWFIEPGAPGPVLTVRLSERTDGYEATALWPAEKRSLTHCAPRAEEAQDGLLELMAGGSSPPAGQHRFVQSPSPELVKKKRRK